MSVAFSAAGVKSDGLYPQSFFRSTTKKGKRLQDNNNAQSVTTIRGIRIQMILLTGTLG